MKSYKSRKVLWNSLNSFEVSRSPSSLLKSILVFGSHLKASEVFQTLRSLSSHWKSIEVFRKKRSHIGGSLLKSLEVFEVLKSAVSPLLVYLISDSIDLRLAALSRWPFTSDNGERIRVIASSKPAKHIIFTKNAQEALQMTIFETFLFSLCETHIITSDSGFGRFPAFARLNRYPIYSFNHWEHPVCAIGEGQVTFTRSGHQWSGIW